MKRKPPSRGIALPEGSRLVVVGNGMVGARFCGELVRLKLNDYFQVSVFGDEAVPAYNRVQLSSYVDHRDGDKLVLKPRSWYAENHIHLRTGTPVREIDRENRRVLLPDGEAAEYDVLVLATGSRPFRPPIEGADLPGVFLYRTIRDLDRIIEAAGDRRTATIIGGGLLGLEAAQAVQKLGLKASVVERAKYFMPQQLNRSASEFLEKEIRARGIVPLLGKRDTVISEEGEGLRLTFGEGDSHDTDLVILSAGIVPNSELAETAGLQVGRRGGIIVNDQLETEDPRIFAIGECALFSGQIFGLAAPGFAMAAHVARRLSQEKTSPFPYPDRSTRLKMLGVDVEIVGHSLQEGRRLEYRNDQLYRMLVLGPKGKLVGAIGVGEWPEAGRIQTMYREGSVIQRNERKTFVKRGTLSPLQGEGAVDQMPESRIICNCMHVSKGRIMECLAGGAATPADLAEKTGASTVCGSCAPLLGLLCGTQRSNGRIPVAVRALLVTSAVALAGTLITIFVPAPAMATSVESVRYQIDALWRDSQIKQITGFTLAGISIAGTLLSARKRIPWFRIGHFANWRFFHAAFGTLSLIALFAHTGFRFGHNLNFWLMASFVGLNLLGAFAGIVSAIEAGASGLALLARRFRPVLVWMHLILFWPLPVLLVFHILSIYLF